MKNMKKVLIMLMVISICILILPFKTFAATPRVMIADYNIKGDLVVAGEDFDLSLVLKNESENKVKNLKITVISENGDLLPSKGAGTAYIKEIKAVTEETITFPMTAVYGLEEKSYKLSVKIEYEGGGVGYNVEEAIYIPVTLSQRISVTDIYTAKNSYEVGETVEISAMINNLGAGTLYNVSAKTQGDCLSGSETYIGNIESGKSGSVDLLTKAIAVSGGDAKKEHLLITYENKSGESFCENFELGPVDVSATIYDDFEVIKDTETKVSVKVIVLVVFAILFLVIIVCFLIKRRKKKLKMLDEF